MAAHQAQEEAESAHEHADWAVYWDARFASPYFFNRVTGETTWTRPASVSRSAVPLNLPEPYRPGSGAGRPTGPLGGRVRNWADESTATEAEESSAVASGSLQLSSYVGPVATSDPLRPLSQVAEAAWTPSSAPTAWERARPATPPDASTIHEELQASSQTPADAVLASSGGSSSSPGRQRFFSFQMSVSGRSRPRITLPDSVGRGVAQAESPPAETPRQASLTSAQVLQRAWRASAARRLLSALRSARATRARAREAERRQQHERARFELAQALALEEQKWRDSITRQARRHELEVRRLRLAQLQAAMAARRHQRALYKAVDLFMSLHRMAKKRTLEAAALARVADAAATVIQATLRDWWQRRHRLELERQVSAGRFREAEAAAQAQAARVRTEAQAAHDRGAEVEAHNLDKVEGDDDDDDGDNVTEYRTSELEAKPGFPQPKLDLAVSKMQALVRGVRSRHSVAEMRRANWRCQLESPSREVLRQLFEFLDVDKADRITRQQWLSFTTSPRGGAPASGWASSKTDSSRDILRLPFVPQATQISEAEAGAGTGRRELRRHSSMPTQQRFPTLLRSTAQLPKQGLGFAASRARRSISSLVKSLAVSTDASQVCDQLDPDSPTQVRRLTRLDSVRCFETIDKNKDYYIGEEEFCDYFMSEEPGPLIKGWLVGMLQEVLESKLFGLTDKQLAARALRRRQHAAAGASLAVRVWREGKKTSRFVELCDSDRGGTVSLKELIDFFKSGPRYCTLATDGALQTGLFRQFDEDGDGELTGDEFSRAVARLSLPEFHEWMDCYFAERPSEAAELLDEVVTIASSSAERGPGATAVETVSSAGATVSCFVEKLSHAWEE